MHSLVSRLSARLAAIPTQRLRRILLAVYLLTAAADAAGKALAANPSVNQALSRYITGERAEELRVAARPSGNFEIFRTASRHLVAGLDLYAEYPAEHSDQFKYSPTFALLFAPFAWLPWPLALFFWSSLNALALFAAVERVLPKRAALLALAFLHLEVLRAMQNAQSNALVAALIVLAFSELERRRAWRAAAAVVLGVCVKVFPLAALSLAIPRRLVWRTGVWAAASGVLLIASPLLVTSPESLLAQYHSWRAVGASDVGDRWFSVMELLHRWLGTNWPNWPVQLGGALALLAPLALRRDRWDDAHFRHLYLCSVLLYIVLFNHQAERASYVIAFAGAALWFAAGTRTPAHTALFLIAFITMPLMSTLIPVGPEMKTPTAMLYRLTAPSLLIWLLITKQLLTSSLTSPSNQSVHSP